MTQLTLDLSPLTEPDYAPHLTIAERFAIFHQQNPHVADTLELLAEQWFRAGHTRVGIKALYERARWESGVTTAGDVWRLNNDWTAHYSRLLLARRPEWADRIHLRELRSG